MAANQVAWVPVKKKKKKKRKGDGAGPGMSGLGASYPALGPTLLSHSPNSFDLHFTPLLPPPYPLGLEEINRFRYHATDIACTASTWYIWSDDSFSRQFLLS